MPRFSANVSMLFVECGALMPEAPDNIYTDSDWTLNAISQ